MNLRSIVIGSRGSDLALWQAHYVQSLLLKQGVESRIEIIKTQGDRIQHLSFDKLEGKGFFTKEIEAALLDQTVDLAVHSHKDLETVQPEGLCIAAVPVRADARDVLVVRKSSLQADNLFCLPDAPKVGTSSARRQAQLRYQIPNVQLLDIRGNVPTRLEKLHTQDFDAIVLAKAGLDRLELVPRDAVVIPLDANLMVPAPAQGALALQVREGDHELKTVLEALNHTATAECVAAERSILRGLEGGCQLPFGAHVQQSGDRLSMLAFLGLEKGHRPLSLGSASATAMADIALRLFKEGLPNAARVLVSRTPEQAAPIGEVLSHWDVALDAQSFIQVSNLPFEPLSKQPDWVFFPSVNAVHGFLAGTTIPTGTKVAAMGPGTADALATRGIYADYTGLGARAEETGAAFAALAGSSSVVIPGAVHMRGTIAAYLKDADVKIVPVYETKGNPISCAPAEVVVLSSASNARAFTEGNAWASEVKHIVATASAAEAFEASPAQNVHVLESLESPTVLCAIFAALLGYSGEY